MAVAGKKGKITIGVNDPVTVVGIKNWSLELSLDTLETTALGDDWKNYITGLKEWTASSDGNYEIGIDTDGQAALQEAYLNGDTVDLKLYVDDTHYYGGKAYINSLSVEDPVDDIVNISIEFTGSGELSFT